MNKYTTPQITVKYFADRVNAAGIIPLNVSMNVLGTDMVSPETKVTIHKVKYNDLNFE